MELKITIKQVENGYTVDIREVPWTLERSFRRRFVAVDKKTLKDVIESALESALIENMA